MINENHNLRPAFGNALSKVDDDRAGLCVVSSSQHDQAQAEGPRPETRVVRGRDLTRLAERYLEEHRSELLAEALASPLLLGPLKTRLGKKLSEQQLQEALAEMRARIESK